jgi:hypothetical protein
MVPEKVPMRSGHALESLIPPGTRRRPRWRVVGPFVVAGALAFALALRGGQASADDAATADALFREGRAAMARGDYDEATRRFAESERLQPAPGTRLNLATAESHTGRLASAWEHARASRDELGPTDERRAVAQKLFEDLDARVPRLTLRSDGKLAAGTRIFLDGTELREGSLGVALPQDPGSHRVLITAPGYLDLPLVVSLREGDRESLQIRLGERQPTAPLPFASGRPGIDFARPSSPLRTVGIVTTIVGGATLAASGIFGALAIGQNGVVGSHCDATGCDDRGLEASRTGHAFALGSTVTAISGLVLVAGGVVLWLLAPRH